jgi:type 1 glutamine amidotransferase
MANLLVLAGGSPHAHDFAASSAALVELLERDGHDVEQVDDPDDAAARLGPDVDALVVSGLWWRMRGATYDPWRADHGYETPQPTRDALASFIAGGGGLVALHSATICFDDWPEWGAIVGGSWRWGISSHPPLGPVTARIVADHPVVDGLPPVVALYDEVYGDLDLRADLRVLAVANRTADDRDQPVVWAHRYEAGRVVYDGFGHDSVSVLHPENGRLIRQGVRWVTLSDDHPTR